jgi:hypothetical protein
MTTTSSRLHSAGTILSLVFGDDVSHLGDTVEIRLSSRQIANLRSAMTVGEWLDAERGADAIARTEPTTNDRMIAAIGFIRIYRKKS